MRNVKVKKMEELGIEPSTSSKDLYKKMLMTRSAK